MIESMHLVAVLAIAVPVLITLLKRISTVAPGAIPGWAQPLVPLVLAGAPVFVAQLEAGASPADAALAGLVAAVGAIGVYHAAKRTPVLGAKS